MARADEARRPRRGSSTRTCEGGGRVTTGRRPNGRGFGSTVCFMGEIVRPKMVVKGVGNLRSPWSARSGAARGPRGFFKAR